MQDGLTLTIIIMDGLDVRSFTCYGPVTIKLTEDISRMITYAFATRGF